MQYKVRCIFATVGVKGYMNSPFRSMVAAEVLDHLEQVFDSDNRAQNATVYMEPPDDFSGEESGGEDIDIQNLPARQLRTRAKVAVQIFMGDDDSAEEDDELLLPCR